MKRLLLVLPLLMAADCTHRAPPITNGKCVVDVYEAELATEQVCVYNGYNYKCTDTDCTRTGEATGELPK